MAEWFRRLDFNAVARVQIPSWCLRPVGTFIMSCFLGFKWSACKLGKCTFTINVVHFTAESDGHVCEMSKETLQPIAA